MNVHALIVLVAPVLAWNPIPNHVLGRRAVVFGAASQAALVVPLVSKADDAQADLLDDMDGAARRELQKMLAEADVDETRITKQLERLREEKVRRQCSP